MKRQPPLPPPQREIKEGISFWKMIFGCKTKNIEKPMLRPSQIPRPMKKPYALLISLVKDAEKYDYTDEDNNPSIKILELLKEEIDKLIESKSK